MKKLRGTAKPSRGHNDPVAAPLKCRAPRWLSADAKRAWRYLVTRLPAGVLGDVDLPALALMCTHLAVAMEAAKIVAREGILVDDPDHAEAKRKNPALQILRDNSLAFRGYAAVFGLTPADRSRLSVPPAPVADEMERYLADCAATYADLQPPESYRSDRNESSRSDAHIGGLQEADGEGEDHVG
jgi:P27 family predicted phage terminase small subunit